MSEFIAGALWAIGGAVYGTPFSAAMGVLPLQTGGSISLRQAVARARANTDWRVWTRIREFLGSDQPRVVRSSSSDGDLGMVVGYAVVSITIVSLYLRYVETVATVMLVVAVLSLLMSATVLFTLYMRDVIDGHRAGWSITGTVALAFGGVYVSVCLLAPPLQNVLVPARTESGGLFTYLPQLSLQFLGALLCFGVLIGSIGLGVANVAAALDSAGGWGAGWLWRGLFWCNRWATARGFAVALWVFMILAVLLCTGVAYTGLEQLRHVVPPFPTPTP